MPVTIIISFSQIEWLQSFVDSIFSETGIKILPEEEIVSFNTEYVRKAYKLFNALDKTYA